MSIAKQVEDSSNNGSVRVVKPTVTVPKVGVGIEDE